MVPPQSKSLEVDITLYTHYPLVNLQKAIENGPVEIVIFPMKNGWIFPVRYVTVYQRLLKIGLPQIIQVIIVGTWATPLYKIIKFQVPNRWLRGDPVSDTGLLGLHGRSPSLPWS